MNIAIVPLQSLLPFKSYVKRYNMCTFLTIKFILAG